MAKRSKAVPETITPAPKRKLEQPAPKPVRASMTQAEALRGFTTQAHSWHRQSIMLVASGSVCLIVGCYTEPRVDYDDMLERLREKVAETGIAQAQIYKYTGLCKALVQHIAQEYPVGGPIAEVLLCKRSDDAMSAIVKYLEKCKVKSLDSLGVMLGKYQRSEPEAGTAPALVPGQNSNGAHEKESNVIVMPSRSTAQAIAQRITAEPEVLRELSEETLVASYVKAGNPAAGLIEESIEFLRTARECTRLIGRLEKKRDAIMGERTKGMTRQAQHA